MTPSKPLAWGNRVDGRFRARVYQLCENLGWSEDHASWLMAVMAFETGRRFRSNTRSPVSTATGLIQFMAATARGMGTTTAALARMSEVEQLGWVERYFRPSAKRIRSMEDMYMAVLWPRGVGQAIEYVLWKTGTREYIANKGLDVNRDGRITKREAAGKVRDQLLEGLRSPNVWVPEARRA